MNKSIIDQFKNMFRRNEMEKSEEPKYYADNGFVICQYCLKEFRQMTKNHLKFHDMTLDEYKAKYPDAPLKRKIIKTDESIITEEKQETKKEPEKNDISSCDDRLLTRELALNIIKAKYSNITTIYTFKKLNKNGQVIYTVTSDFGDYDKRTMIDFIDAPWHYQTLLFTPGRKKELLNMSKWKYIVIDENVETVKDLIEFLKNLK